MTCSKGKFIAGAMALATAFCAAAGPDAFKFNKDGSLAVDGIPAKIIHFDPGWGLTSQGDGSVAPEAGYPKEEGGVWIFKGKFSVKGGVFSLEERASKLSGNSISYEASVKSEQPVPTKELALCLSLPVESFAGRTLDIGGEKVSLPVEFNEVVVKSKAAFGSFTLPCQATKMRVEGDGSVLVQDDRKFEAQSYSLRFRFTPSAGDLTESRIKLKMDLTPYDTKPISMTGAANMGFTDDVEGDKAGGWTDQGPENDLRMIKPGLVNLSGVSFSIIDPAKNGGKSCLVLAGGQREYFPKSAEIDVDGRTMKNLCVLHSLAWAPGDRAQIGKIVVSYQDGSKSEVPVMAKEHVGDWWNAATLPKGDLVWTGENKSAYVGLFLSQFPVEAKPVSKVAFESSGKAVWMIVAASSSNDDIPKTASIPFYIVQSKEWKPIEYPRDVEKGSALDLSFLVDAPAGKHGRTIVNKDGKFAFETKPETPVRFYGTNLCFTANYLDKETCERLADRLAACGYNSVRFHHFDGQLADKKGPGTTSLDPAELDKFDYLFHCLKQRGLYITIDLFISRRAKAGEIPEVNRNIEQTEYKALTLLLDSARKNWEDFSRSLLEHVNPYTGMAWKDDPALATISLVNEDTIFSCWQSTPDTTRLYNERFAEWLKSKGIEADPEQRSKLMNVFLVELYNSSYAKMRDFVRSLGCKALISDQNMVSNVPLTLTRQHYDYVDNHFYFDHPHFTVKPWSLPSSISNKSALSSFLSTPGTLFPSRYFGKPFTVTEFNWAFPCAYRGESGPVTGAYASLQDWDALYRFAYSHRAENVVKEPVSNYFDSSTDPINALSDRIGVLLFLRGDVKPSAISFPTAVSSKHLENGGPQGFPKLSWQLGLVGKVGSMVYSGNSVQAPLGAGALLCFEDGIQSSSGAAPCNVATQKDADALAKIKAACDFGKGALDVEKGFARSSTGEIEADKTAGTFKVVTARSETFVFSANGRLEGAALSVDNKGGATTISVSAIDGKELKDSSRMLVMHLTDVMNSKTKFGGKQMKVLESYGTLPHLARKGEADIALKLSAGGQTPKVWALDLAGKRVKEAQSSFSPEGVLSFKADTFGAGTPCLAYEISR